jgi:pyruvate formate lyase activating enzyme
MIRASSMHTANSGVVLNIQRFSIHDGPGIRSTVFLKGCSLRCFWCHNPESIRMQPEVQLFPERCIACDECVRVCPQGARAVEASGLRSVDRANCDACGICVDSCFAGATVMAGALMRVEEVLAEVLRDQAFYASSHGGVTLSGGEPVLQSDFARAVLQGCRAAGIHTAIETAGNYPWRLLEPLLPLLDLVMMDLKQMDPEKHRWATGASNERVLATARRITSETDLPVVFRIPVVPTVNDAPDEIRATARVVRELAVQRAERASAAPISLELLTFHKLASDKYHSLDMAYRAAAQQPLSKEQMNVLAGIATDCGVPTLAR